MKSNKKLVIFQDIFMNYERKFGSFEPKKSSFICFFLFFLSEVKLINDI